MDLLREVTAHMRETGVRRVRMVRGPLELEVELDPAAQYLGGNEIVIRVDLGIADGGFTVYGCDLTEGYVDLNSGYTT